jgi:hypothetical protein
MHYVPCISDLLGRIRIRIPATWKASARIWRRMRRGYGVVEGGGGERWRALCWCADELGSGVIGTFGEHERDKTGGEWIAWVGPAQVCRLELWFSRSNYEWQGF